MSKLIYVVNGSEDGIIGVFGNVKGAYDRACEYIKGSYTNPEVLTTYSEALKSCKSWGAIIESNNDTNATIYTHVLNS